MLWERLLAELRAKGVDPWGLVVADNGNLPQILGLEAAALPSVFHSIDTFCNPWHAPYASAFDAVLVAQAEHLPLFDDPSVPARHFPLFSFHVNEPETPDQWLAVRDIPVSFVGTLDPRNIPSRRPFLEAFQALHPLHVLQGPFIPLFSRARIVLNHTAAAELNFRSFEAPACGAALLMEATPGLESCFTPGENILPPFPRNNAAAAVAVARFWLARPERLAAIALAGRELIAAKHSATVRAVELLALLEALAAARAHTARLAELPRRQMLLSTAYAILAAELSRPDLVPHRELYAALFAELAPRPV